MSLIKNSPSKRVIEQYAEIRFIIAFLGEKSQFNWWETITLSSIGDKYHSMLFPRTNTLSRLLAATKAAEKHHDDLIGKNRSYHLFRMPTSIEQALHTYYLNNNQECNNYDQDKALARLTELSCNEKPTGKGPVQIGVLKQIRTSKAIQLLSSHYAQAFKAKKITVPFFSDD